MKRKKACVVFLILAGASIAFLSQAGRFLVREDPIVKADAVLVFSGDPYYERTLEAVRLYKEGWVRKIILTGRGYSGDDALYMKDVAVHKGVRAQDILLENTSTSTYTNILYTHGIIASHGFTSVTLVSSPYHLRRIWALAKRIYDEDSVRLYCHPVKKSVWSPEGWWKKAHGRRPVFQEYKKLLAYWLFGVVDQHDGGILWKSNRAM